MRGVTISNMNYQDEKLRWEVTESLKSFHGHNVRLTGEVTTPDKGTLPCEAYVWHPDGTHGYEHTVDGVTWILRERSIFDRQLS